MNKERFLLNPGYRSEKKTHLFLALFPGTQSDQESVSFPAVVGVDLEIEKCWPLLFVFLKRDYSGEPQTAGENDGRRPGLHVGVVDELGDFTLMRRCPGEIPSKLSWIPRAESLRCC